MKTHPGSPLRVCSFESRRATEMKSLIERQGAIATLAPSMREIPLEDNVAVFEFADELFAGQIDIVVFMTGVGASALLETLETRFERSQIFSALEKSIIVVRGPKPTAILRGWGVRIDHRAPEPNTWREVFGLFESIPLAGRRVAVQEYGAPSIEFYQTLQSAGATVMPVPVYRWGLPEDIEPLRKAIRQSIAGEFDVLMFTSAQQLNHVLAVAAQDGLREAWLDAVRRNECVIASIGPTATETLMSAGLKVDVEPSHANMGSLVKDSLVYASSRLTTQNRSGYEEISDNNLPES